MKFAIKPILVGAAAGLAVTIVLLCLVVSGISGVSESVLLGQVFFPYAASVSLDTQAWVILSLLFLQYPFYGALLGFVCNQVKHRWLILVPLLALLIGGHLATFKSARRADAIWVASQGGE